MVRRRVLTLLSGYSLDWIAEQMTRTGFLTSDGNSRWQHTTILYALTNEKYVGDALSQKTFASAFPFVKKRNKGERDKFYTENTHPAIISKETFNKVQELLKRKSCRQEVRYRSYPLTLKVRCGECGTPFARREGRSGLVVWTCRKHDKGASRCPMGRIPEAEIYAAFVRMYNKLKQNEGIVLKPVLRQLEDLNTALQRDNPAMLAINQAIAQTAEQSHKISVLQTRGLLDADACATKLQGLNAQMTQLRRERRRLMKNEDIEETASAIRRTADIVRCGPEQIAQFDEELFHDLVERITAESQTCLRFQLYGGLELTERLREAGR